MKDMLFIDTSVFVALNDLEDEFHEKSVDWVKSRLGETIGLCTSYEVVAETATVLRKKLGFRRARKFLKIIREPGIQILDGNEEIKKNAWELFVKTKDVEGLSFWDVLKVETMKYYGLIKIFSFDEVFDHLTVIRTPK